MSRPAASRQGQAQPRAKSLDHQFTRDLPRPQAKTEPRIAVNFSYEPNVFLPRQGAWASGRGNGLMHEKSLTMSSHTRSTVILQVVSRVL